MPPKEMKEEQAQPATKLSEEGLGELKSPSGNLRALQGLYQPAHILKTAKKRARAKGKRRRARKGKETYGGF